MCIFIFLMMTNTRFLSADKMVFIIQLNVETEGYRGEMKIRGSVNIESLMRCTVAGLHFRKALF